VVERTGEEETPMATQFKSMNELVDYMNQVEHRISVLETENDTLRTQLHTIDTRSLDVIAFVKENWPQTGLTSNSWWIRALTVYGYFFVINLIITVVLGIFSMLIFGSMIASALSQFGPAGIR
jgi:hypothetical protein